MLILCWANVDDVGQHSQQTRDVEPILGRIRPIVYNAVDKNLHFMKNIAFTIL